MLTVMIRAEVGPAFIEQCKYAIAIFTGSFVVGKASSGASGARVLAVPSWVGKLAPRMSRALLTGLAEDMVRRILFAHGKVYVGVGVPKLPTKEPEIKRMKMFVGMVLGNSGVGLMPRG